MRVIAPDAEVTKSLNLPLTPMIDVFMNLLCFFMVAGHFREVERQLASELPRLGGPSIPGVDPELWIRIQNGGDAANPVARIEIDGRVRRGWGEVESALAAYGRITRVRASAVIIAPDKDAEHGWVLRVLGILQERGFSNINFKR